MFGDLADAPVYLAAFSNALSALWKRGVRATFETIWPDRL